MHIPIVEATIAKDSFKSITSSVLESESLFEKSKHTYIHAHTHVYIHTHVPIIEAIIAKDSSKSITFSVLEPESLH